MLHVSGWVRRLYAWIYVSKFLKQQAHEQSKKFKATHKQKLRNLRLDIYEGLGDEPQVVDNLTNRALTETEYKALNHGLQFGILPLKFNFIDVQTEFENLYWQVRPHLQNTKRILFKTKLINLHNKYKSTYFYDKLCGNTGLSPSEMEALLSIREDKSLIICKPDKGNGVVLMNKTDYVQKMNANFVGREKVCTGQKRQKCQKPEKVSKLLESIKKRKTPRWRHLRTHSTIRCSYSYAVRFAKNP